jgi:DNA repair protein RadC
MGIESQRIKRLKQKLIKSGYTALRENELLELLLNVSTPDKDHFQQAKEAARKYNGFRGISTARPEELLKLLDDFDENDAFTLILMRELGRRAMNEITAEKPIYQTGQEVFNTYYYDMRDLKEELFKVIYLDSRKMIMGTEDLVKRLTDSSQAVYPREVIERALKSGARYLVFIHNHPPGDPSPSRADKEITRNLVYAGMIVEIRVLDHIIFGDNRFFSFSGEGLIKQFEDDYLRLKIRGNSGTN